MKNSSKQTYDRKVKLSVYPCVHPCSPRRIPSLLQLVDKLFSVMIRGSVWRFSICGPGSFPFGWDLQRLTSIPSASNQHESYLILCNLFFLASLLLSQWRAVAFPGSMSPGYSPSPSLPSCLPSDLLITPQGS